MSDMVRAANLTICSCGGPLPCPQKAAIERAFALGGASESREERFQRHYGVGPEMPIALADDERRADVDTLECEVWALKSALSLSDGLRGRLAADLERALENVDDARAEVERVKDLVCDREDTIIEQDAKIERLEAERDAARAVIDMRDLRTERLQVNIWDHEVRAALDAPTESTELAACRERHPVGKALPGVQAAFDRRAE